jgi:GH24 family phage-related lysozyme (muramidase)
MRPVIQLAVGDDIAARHGIGPERVRSWRYAAECPRQFFPVPAHGVLKIFELDRTPGSPWVKAYLPNTHDTMFLKISGEELAMNFHLVAARADAKRPKSLGFSARGWELLTAIELLRLKPYDDQTGKEVSKWTAGATIGYGHLITSAQWHTYARGITPSQARTLLTQDLAPFVAAVQAAISVDLTQNQFDALVLLAFNIGADAFKGSAVVTLINDPHAKTRYANLEAAWKAWNKSQGAVMKGLENRRNSEWNIYELGIYRKW